MPLASRGLDWLDERLGYRTALRVLLHRRLPRGVGWQHTFGSATLFLLLIQLVTGILLALNYAPTPDHAYDSIRYIETEVAFGKLLRGLHRWSATLLVIIIGLHVLRVYWWGGYKRPRELNWVLGVFLLVMVMAFGFTGYLLPWDQKAYWATVVGTHIVETAPGIGPFLMRVIRGGAEVGPNTLTRFFTLHVLVLPIALFLLIALHLALVVRHGIAGISAEVERQKSGAWFYPEHVIKDAVMAAMLLAAAFTLAVAYGAPLEEPADPAAVGYVPLPEWYFLWLYRSLWYFKGPWEPVGTVVIPLFLLMLFLSLPFVDRNPERRPHRRPFATALGSLFVATLIFLTVSGARVPRPPVASLPAPAATSVQLSGHAQEGRELYATLACASCHSIAGSGSTAGPDLTRVGSRRDAAWLTEFFHAPQRVVPNATMPVYDLSHEQVDRLVEYLVTLK